MFSRFLHKYLALIVAVQLLIWLSTGLLLGQMHSAPTIEKRVENGVDLSENDEELMTIKQLLALSPNAISIELVNLLGKSVYRVMTEYSKHEQEKTYELYDAVTGEQFNLNEVDIRRLVTSKFQFTSPITNVSLVQPPFSELPKEKSPLWKVAVFDEFSTHIYLRASSGDIVAALNENSEWTSLLMMLHFMDYQNAGSFNHWWIKLFALLTLVMSITGVTWLLQIMMTKPAVPGTQRTKKWLTVIDDKEAEHRIEGRVTDNLLSILQRNKISIESQCGGSGTCGRCRVVIKPTDPVLTADRYQLSKDQLKAGYRLACQRVVGQTSIVRVDTNTLLQTISAELVNNEFLTPFIKELKFKYHSPETFVFRPGCYFKFSISKGKTRGCPPDLPRRFRRFWPYSESSSFFHPSVTRYYSVANRCEGAGYLTFNIKMQPAPSSMLKPGIGSHVLGNLGIGSVLEIEGPYGGFSLPHDFHKKEFVLIGGGSGIAPLKSMIDELLFGLQVTQSVVLFYGARHPIDLANHNWFKDIETTLTNFSYCPVVSRASNIWFGATGHVQLPLRSFLEAHHAKSQCLFFLCGPSAMMNEVKDMLIDYSIDPNAITVEAFASSTTHQV